VCLCSGILHPSYCTPTDSFGCTLQYPHFDFNPFSPQNTESDDRSICGKVVYSPSRFVYVPSTHSPEFLTSFAREYAPHYPNVKKSDTKFGLDKDKPDPKNLISQKITQIVPGGSLLIWHPRLLHAQEKTPKHDPIEYGNYLGFFPAGSRPQYKEKCGVDELEDRLHSYQNGVAPLLWPSRDRVHYYPARWNNFLNILDSQVKKIPDGHPTLATRYTKNGRKVVYMTQLPQTAYTPPPLTTLGNRVRVGVWARVCVCVFVCLCACV